MASTLNDEEEKSSLTASSNITLGDKIGCTGGVFNGINTIALMLRMELYVDENRWKNSSKETRISLNTFITCCEEKLYQKLIEWNKKRTHLTKSKLFTNEGFVNKLVISENTFNPKEYRENLDWQNINLGSLKVQNKRPASL